MKFDDENIRSLLTPRCSVKTSPGFSQKVMAEIETMASRQIRIFGWSLPRRAASIAAISLLAMCAVAAIAVFNYDTKVEEPTTVSIPDSIPLPPQPELPLLPLKYSDATLATILDDVAARYGCTVNYADSSKRDIRLHITIGNEATLKEAIEIINQFDNISVTLSDNIITVK